MFHIVEFVPEGGLAIVPMSWIITGTEGAGKARCQTYWPPFKYSMKLKNLVRKSEVADPQWKIWNVKKLASSSTHQYLS